MSHSSSNVVAVRPCVCHVCLGVCTADELNCAVLTQFHDALYTGRNDVTSNVRRILVRGVSPPLPPEAKKILKI